MFANEPTQLLAYLDLERIEVNLFRGLSPMGRRDRIFGGRVLTQAMVAAGRTVEDRVAHSLHGYFLRPGDPKTPLRGRPQIPATRPSEVFPLSRLPDRREPPTTREA